ncbi:MAG TPA: ATP-binding cassette domain-containing protein [Ilumatobacteraceae bacterium]
MTDSTSEVAPVLEASGLVKAYGAIVALDHADFAVFPGEVLAVVGDNGTGKTTLIRCLSGAETPDAGVIRLHGAPVRFRNRNDARTAGINTVFQSLDVEPALDIATSLFRGHEISRRDHVAKALRWLEEKGVRKPPAALQSNVIMLDEPTAALGARESLSVRRLIANLRDRGLPIVVVTHNIGQAFDIADRIHIQRLAKRAAVVTPQRFTVADVLAIMRGDLVPDPADQALRAVR